MQIATDANRILELYRCILVSACVLITILTLFAYLRKKVIKPEKLFPILVLCFGIVYMFAITPFSVPDEIPHYYSSFYISDIILGFPNSVVMDDLGFVRHMNSVDGYITLATQLFSDGSCKMITSPFGDILYNFLFTYIPQGISITLSRILDLNCVLTFMLGRFANLLFFATCLHFALKIIPKFKMVIGTVSLFPMTLQMVSSYSYDSYVLGITFVFIALCIRAIYSDKAIDKKEYLLILLFAILMAPVKIVYSSLILLFLLIPSKRFRSQKEKAVKFVVIAILVVASIVAVNSTRLDLFTTSSLSSEEIAINDDAAAVPGTEQFVPFNFKDCINNPKNVFNVLKDSIILYSRFWVLEAIGYSLSGLNLVLPYTPILLFGLILLLFSIRNDDHDFTVGKKNRIGFIIVVLFTFFLTLMAMLFVYTPNDAQLIRGVQGRYFIPLIPLAMAVINNQKITIRKDIDGVLVCGLCALETMVVYLILTITITA